MGLVLLDFDPMPPGISIIPHSNLPTKVPVQLTIIVTHHSTLVEYIDLMLQKYFIAITFCTPGFLLFPNLTSTQLFISNKEFTAATTRLISCQRRQQL